MCVCADGYIPFRLKYPQPPHPHTTPPLQMVITIAQSRAQKAWSHVANATIIIIKLRLAL